MPMEENSGIQTPQVPATEATTQVSSAAPPPESAPSSPTGQVSQMGQQGQVSQMGQPTQQGQQEQMVSVLDWARQQLGGQVPWQDDAAMMRQLIQLYQQAPQLTQLARYGQEYQRNFPDFSRWQQEQAAKQQQQAQTDKAKGWWNPPISREEAARIASQCYTQGPDGNPRQRPDAPMASVQKLADYNTYVSEWQEKLAANPQEALQQPIQEIVRQELARSLEAQNAQSQAAGVIQRNADWLFLKGPDGQPQMGAFTPQGQAFQGYVQEAGRIGIRDALAQERYALSQMELAHYRYQVQQQAANTQQAAQQQAAAQAATQATSQLSRTPSAVPQRPTTVRNAQDLERIMTSALQQGGYDLSQ